MLFSLFLLFFSHSTQQDIQYDYRGQIEKEMESLYGNSKQAASLSPTLKQQHDDDSQQLEEDIDDDNRDDKEDDKEEEAYVKAKQNGFMQQQQQQQNHHHSNEFKDNQKSFDYYLDTVSRSSIGDDTMDQENDLDNLNNTRRMSRSTSKENDNNNSCNNLSNNNSNSNSTSFQRRQSKNFNYSPDTTDYDSESSMRFISSDYPSIPTINASSATVEISGGPITTNYTRYCTSMPVLEDGLSSGHASDNENNNNNIPVSLSNDLNTYFNKRNSSSIASSISTIQKQYQENLVQTHANNNIFYNGNNNSSSGNNSATATLNGSKNLNNNNNSNNTLLLNNGDIHDTKVRSAQSPPNFHPYYAMRYDNTSKDSMTRYDSSSSKETLRYENSSKEMINRYDTKEPLINSSHTSLMNSNKIFKNRDPDLESLYTISKYCVLFFKFITQLV